MSGSGSGPCELRPDPLEAEAPPVHHRRRPGLLLTLVFLCFNDSPGAELTGAGAEGGEDRTGRRAVSHTLTLSKWHQHDSLQVSQETCLSPWNEKSEAETSHSPRAFTGTAPKGHHVGGDKYTPFSHPPVILCPSLTQREGGTCIHHSPSARLGPGSVAHPAGGRDLG